MRTLIALISGRSIPELLDERGWRNLLDLADRTRTTQMLSGHPDLPPWVQSEIETRVMKIVQRRARLLETYGDAAEALSTAGIEFVLIKGFTHELDAKWDASLRAQCDIDLLCRPSNFRAGQDALLKRGFVFHAHAGLSDIHGWPLLKPHDWKWQGDYFDPLQPVPVDLHPTIWNASRERLAAPGTESFWERREWLDAAGLRVPAFCDVDRLGLAALHLLRHILQNDVQPGHAWELARMLQRRAQDLVFWKKWRTLHPLALRSLETIAFRFASVWFGGELPEMPAKDWDTQPGGVHAWFERNAFSPLENLEQPNKNIIWLHLALLPRSLDRFAVARQRLLPLHLPPPGAVPRGSYLAHVAGRARYHLLALAGAFWNAALSSTARNKASHTPD